MPPEPPVHLRPLAEGAAAQPPGWLWRRRLSSTDHRPLISAMGVALAAVGCAPAGPRTPASAIEVLRHQIVLPGASGHALSYLEAGNPRGPQLILVHGTPGSASGWSDYLLDPPPGMQVLALDRPGFGRSGPAGAQPALADQAAAVHALMARDGRPVVLLGHSLGGPVVAQLAADFPDQVSALVLLAASLDPAQEKIHPLQHVGNCPGISALLPRALRNANVELLALKPQLESLADRLPRVRAKVLIVHGTQDDLVPAANVPFMQARLTGARCVQTVMLEGRNHFLPWNSQETVRDAIGRALDPRC